MRKCSTCKIEKYLSNFHLSKKDGFMYICKSCNYEKKTKWRKDNPDKENMIQHRSDKIRGDKRKNNINEKRKYRNTQLRIKYGISIDEYDIKFNTQNGVCAICKKSTKNFLCVDHDHLNGKIRGLLCHQCNLVIGNANDNINTLQESIKYLQIYKKDN